MAQPETVIIKPYVGKSPTGQITYGPTRTVTGCTVWPRTTDEIEAGGAIIDGLNIYKAGADLASVKANDRITARGKEWDIDGVPAEYRPNSGQKVILQTKRVGS